MSAYEDTTHGTPASWDPTTEARFCAHAILLILPFMLMWLDASKTHYGQPMADGITSDWASFALFMVLWIVYVWMSTLYLGALRVVHDSDGPELILFLCTLGSSALAPAVLMLYGVSITWLQVLCVSIGVVLTFGISGILFHANVLFWGPWKHNPDDEGMTVAGFQG